MNILFATDGSRYANIAGHLVARLPWPATRELTVLSVIDEPQLLSPEAQRTDEAASHEGEPLPVALRQHTQDFITREVDRFTAMGWSPQLLIREGHAAHQILSAAEELGTDVIVIGSRGLGGVKRFLLGSVSQQVMTHASCSVLIGRRADDPNGNAHDDTIAFEENDIPLRIMLAYDGSPMAEAAVDMLTSLSPNDRTHILVTTIMTLITYYRMDILQTMSTRWQAEKQTAQDRLEHVAQRLRHITPHVTMQLRESDDTSQALLDTAHDFGAELIVVGHQGKSGIERWLLGSVASRVVHHAPCSVWVVRR
jgi:nucleotide-binding universal stress UspA family protein